MGRGLRSWRVRRGRSFTVLVVGWSAPPTVWATPTDLDEVTFRFPPTAHTEGGLPDPAEPRLGRFMGPRVFLSGGQTDEVATAHLKAMNALAEPHPRSLGFSDGRALPAAALKAWKGDPTDRGGASRRLPPRPAKQPARQGRDPPERERAVAERPGGTAGHAGARLHDYYRRSADAFTKIGDTPRALICAKARATIRLALWKAEGGAFQAHLR